MGDTEVIEKWNFEAARKLNTGDNTDFVVQCDNTLEGKWVFWDTTGDKPASRNGPIKIDFSIACKISNHVTEKKLIDDKVTETQYSKD